MVSPAQPPATDLPLRQTPHFEISVEDGRGLLMLRPGRFFSWLRIDQLELVIPNVTFPLDITGGMSQFQRQRCPLLAATLGVDAAGLSGLVARRAGPLQRAGFENVTIELHAGGIDLTALARVRERSAELFVRLTVDSDGRLLRLQLDEAVTLGWVRRPSALLAHDLLCILLGAVDASRGSPDVEAVEGPTVHGLGVIVLRPLELLAATLLSPAGWRLPDFSGVRVSGIEIAPEQVRVKFAASAGEPEKAASRPAILQRISEPLLRNDLGSALAACREELGSEPAVAQAVTKHMLDLLSARDGSLREAELIARDAVLRWPGFVHGHLCLAAIAESKGRHGEATEQFAEAARLADAGGRVSLAVRATLAAARGAVDADPTRAIALYEQVSKRRPGDEQVVAALGELYVRNNRWSELARLYQGQVASAVDPRVKAAAHLRLGEVLFVRLHDPAGGRRELEEATRLDPKSRRAWDLRADIAIRGGDRQAALAALRHAAALLAEGGDPIAEARTLTRIGVLLEQGGDAEGARDHYRRAVSLTPEDPGVLQSFATLAEAHGETADALHAYQRLATSPSAAPEAKRTAQAKLLGLYVQLDDVAGARRALAERGSEADAETLARLASLEEAAGELVAADRLLERAARQAEGVRRGQLELERARLFRLAGDLEQEHAALVRAHALAPDGPVGLEAARALVAVARAMGDPADEARWLDGLIACAPADAPELALRRAQLYLGSGDARAALAILDRASDELHRRGDVRRLYADVLGAVQDFAGRASILEGLAGEATTDDERAALLAGATESHLQAGDVASAHRVALAAEQRAPADGRVRLMVAEVAWRRRSWEEVVTLYDELFAESRGAERAEHGRRLGIALERLGRPTEALAVFRRAIDAEDAAGPPLAVVWRALAEAYERAGDYTQTAETLRAAALDPRTGDPPPLRAELLRRGSELLHRRAGAHVQAVALLHEALRVAPDDLLTLDTLDALQSELGDASQLERTLQRKLGLTTATRAQRLEWLSRLVELTGGRDAETARHHHASILELDPDHEPSLRFVLDDAWARGDLETAALKAARLMARPDLPPEERLALHLRLAEIAEQRDDAGEAEVQLWAAVELSSPGERPALLRRLESVYARTGRFAEVAMVLSHHESLVEGPARLELQVRRIEITLRELKTPASALESLAAPLQHHPDDPRLLALWVESARAAGATAQLVDGLFRLAAHTRATDARTRLVAEAAELQLQRGGQLAAAEVALVAQMLDVHLAELAAKQLPFGQTVLALFEVLRRHGDDPAARRSLADGLVAAAASAEPDQATAWLLEAADLRRGRLDDFVGAADALARAAALAPTPQIVADLETLLTDLGDWPRLAALYEQELQRVTGEPRVLVLEKLVRLHADSLGDEAAAERWRAEIRQRTARTSQVSVAALVRTIAPGQAPPAPAALPSAASAIERAERKLITLSDVREACRTRMDLGRLYAQAGRPAEAQEHLRAVLAEEPSHRPALELLIDVTQKLGQWREAAQACEQLSHVLEDPTARADALFREGELYLGKLGDKERAAESYLEAIDLDPTHVPTVRRLIDYFWSIDDRGSVVEMAAALDDEAFAASETAVVTRARAALASALTGDRRAMKLGAKLGAGGAQALARAVADASGRTVAARQLVQAVALVCASAPPLKDETRRALAALAANDQRLRAIASQI